MAINFGELEKLQTALDTNDMEKAKDIWPLVGNAKSIQEYRDRTNEILTTPNDEVTAIDTMQNYMGASPAVDKEFINPDPAVVVTPGAPNPMVQQFSTFVTSLFSSITSFFNKAADTVGQKMTYMFSKPDAAPDPSADPSKDVHDLSINTKINNTDLTYGGAIGIGLTGALLVFIVYKIVQKFRNRNVGQLETYSYAINKSKDVLKESLYLHGAVHSMLLKEDAGSIDGVRETMVSAGTTAKELVAFLQEEPSESDGKIISFLKKYSPFIKICLMGVAAVALGGIGYAAYSKLVGGENPMPDAITNAQPGSFMDSGFAH